MKDKNRPMSRYARAGEDPKLYFSKYLGIELVDLREGYAKGELAVRPELLNRLGILHGGVAYSLADTCMGGAVFSQLEDDQYCVAMEVKANYLRPVTEGRLTAEARVAHCGQRVAVATCEVRDGNGQLVAMATGSFYIFTGAP